MKFINKLRSVLNRKNIAILATSCLLMTYASNASAFACRDSTGKVINSAAGGSGVFTVRAQLTPSIQVGQNLVVDLNSSVSCRNEDPKNYIDWVSLRSGSMFDGDLSQLTGTVRHYSSSYPLPLNSSTQPVAFRDINFVPWNVQLFLKPISTASGILITQGSLIAVLKMNKYSTDPRTGARNGREDNFTWNIYADNTVVIPTGGCDVTARDVTVNLPDYPGTAPVPVNVFCANNNQRLSYYVTGTTTDGSNSIFTNTASNPAQGVGIQLLNNKGTALTTNQHISLGRVGTSPVNLGLSARYAETAGQITAGNVQSIIGVYFVYE